MTDALVPLDVEALTALPLGERVGALTAAYRGWRRMNTQMAWGFGRGLCAVRGNYSKGSGDWGRVLDTIGIEHSKARRYMRIAEHDAVEIARHLTVDAAYKALPAKRPVKALKAAPEPAEPEPTPAPAFNPRAAFGPAPPPEPETEPAAVSGELLSDAEAAAAVQEAVDEVGPLPEGRLEVTEGERKATQRYREAVATINAGRKREQAKDRKLRDICDALLLLPPSPGVADVLARFWNKAKRAA